MVRSNYSIRMTFQELATAFEQIESVSSRLAITELLAGVLTRAHVDEIRALCYLLQGRVAPQYEPIEFGVANKFVETAIAKASGVDRSRVYTHFKSSGDYGDSAFHFLSTRTHSEKSVSDVFAALLAIAHTGGEGSQEVKITLLSDLFCSLDRLSTKYIVRITLGKLRLGFSDMTILDALSWMISGDKRHHEVLEKAYSHRPDIGYIAMVVKKDGIDATEKIALHVGDPVIPSLCQRLPTADEMIEKMGEVSVEPKYDGFRAQIHFAKHGKDMRVVSYSRNLENTTAMFPELLQISQEIAAESVIIDTEAVGIDPKTGRILPFQSTITRKRKHDVAKTSESVPLQFFVFDILHKDGKDLVTLPLSERRRILEKTIHAQKYLSIAPHIVTKHADELRSYHETQITNGLEGVVVKTWNSPYEMGRKGFNWVKFKEEEGKTGKLTDTIDAVIMGYTSGEGKRTSFGIGQMLLGVRDGETFVTITKLGSGTTEEELTALYATLQPYIAATMPKQYVQMHKNYIPDVWVHPHVVLEIAGDDLTVSPTHGAHFAVRFPRLVRIRADKSAEDVTTVAEIEGMYKMQFRKA